MKGICLIIWMVFTLILTFSIIGLILFFPKDRYVDIENKPSTWMSIGIKLLDSVIK